MARPTAAETIGLKIYPENGPDTNCPEQVTAYETARPYQEGGYARDGTIVLGEIANNIQLWNSTPFSATWKGALKPQFKDCRGTAGIYHQDEDIFSGHSYIRLQLLDGEVFAILDMTGVQDANDYTAVILFKGMKHGNPRWTWGGSD